MTRAILATLAALALLVAGLLLRPHTPSPADGQGDPDLVAAVEAAGQPGYRLTVIVLDGDTERRARFDGAGPRTRYEIGSISKAVTGLLLADAVDRGEITLDDPAGEHLDLGSSPASQVTLRELATHSSGLPRLAVGLSDLPGSLWAQVTASNPYDETPADVVSDAAGAAVGEKTFAYSNLGTALAGQAVAVAAGTPYPQLVEERLLGPLQLQDTALQVAEPLVEPGRDLAGRRQQPWVIDGMAPTGGVVSTPDDMTRFARALLAGDAPGMSALDPIADTDDEDRIGLYWFTTAYPDAPQQTYAWHNGATGGYSSYLAVDREQQRAVIVLNAASDGAAQLGTALFTDPDTWS